MECIFFETALDVTSTISKHHARIDCVPVSPEVMDKAPMYFKKAIEDATSDWAQHASKGCIETESRHLQRKIPPNFPYVHIEFGLSRGFVSVIDEPREFDRNFARESSSASWKVVETATSGKHPPCKPRGLGKAERCRRLGPTSSNRNTQHSTGCHDGNETLR